MKAFYITVCILLVLAAVELVARFGLGLGDPPVSLPDDEIDYIFAPCQNCNRFGNKILYNDFSMRCEFQLEGTSPARRVFVVGDSVINGGVLTDHEKLATTIVQRKLDPGFKQTQVLNVSAGSWGPGNYAAYFRRYRNLVRTNDIVIVEVNSHDLWEDDPRKTRGSMVGKDVALPDRKPLCALQEGFERYFLPRVTGFFGKIKKNTKVDVVKWGADVQSKEAQYNLEMLDEVYALPWGKRYMLIHRSRKEALESKISMGEEAFRSYARENSIDIIECALDPAADYRDVIHPSDTGQAKIADAIVELLEG